MRCMKINNGHQHQQRSGERIDKEFEGSLDPFLPAPDRRKEINGDQRQLPEKIEQERILRQEDTHQSCLGQQHQRIEVTGILIFIPPGRDKNDGKAHRCQQAEDLSHPVQPGRKTASQRRQPCHIHLQEAHYPFARLSPHRETASVGQRDE